MRPEDSKAFIDAVEKLAFDMPAPNPYTPQFVMLCVEARRLLNQEREQQHRGGMPFGGQSL